MLDHHADEPLRVRIVEASPQRLVLMGENYGAIDIVTQRYVLDVPVEAGLRPRSPIR
jgi:hypothetical protein